MMRIAAIIPTHGRPALLREAIGSVLRQTRLPEELIVVDDVGDPETAQLVLSQIGRAPLALRYIHNSRCPGACSSRNLGALLSSGDWFAFLDDDDVWLDHFVERASARAANHDVGLVMTGITRQENGFADTSRFTPEGLTAETVLDHRSSMTGSNMLIAADAFSAVRGFDPAMTVFNDWDLLVRVIRAGIPYAVVAEPLAEWREHGGERIATPSLGRAAGIEAFLDRYERDLPGWMRRELRTTALGIRRRHATATASYLGLSIRLALAHGPRAALSRIRSRYSGDRSVRT
jgi:glycosyltransferase involved in cell wall biosynthesis